MRSTNQPGDNGNMRELEDSAFLDLLSRNRVALHASEGQLRVSAAAGVLNDELKDELRRRKVNLLTLLEGLPSLSVIDDRAEANEPVHPIVHEQHVSRLSCSRDPLTNFPQLLELPFSRQRPMVPSFDTQSVPLQIPEHLVASLRRLAETELSSLNTLLLAAFAALIYRYTGQPDFSIGALASPHNAQQTEPSIEHVENTIIVCCQPQPSWSFRDLFKHVRRAALEACAHNDPQFNRLATELHTNPVPGVSPVIQIMFAFDVSKSDGQSSNRKPESITEVSLPPASSSGAPRFDLIVRRDEATNPVLSLCFEYRIDLFPSESMQQFVRGYSTLLHGIVQQPDHLLTDVGILTEAELQKILIDWNQTQLEVPKGALIHSLFTRQAASAPNAIAVICGAETVTYAELNDRANQLAHLLLRRGLKPEECVGICMKRAISMVIAMLAVLKAGGAYLPLDPAYPPQRLETMLNDSRSRIVCSESEALKRLPLGEREIIVTDAEAKTIAQMPTSNPSVEVHPNHLAYVIYTSGSTGQPKGVAIEHHSTVSLLHWGRTTYTPLELARVLASTSICFDLSVFEIFLPLSSGHAIVLVDDILQLAQASAVSSPTLINTVPSAMTALLAAGGIPNSVLCVNLAGEPLPTSLVKRIEEHIPSVRIFDLYGPTETTTYSTFARRQSSAPATIGRPLANTQIFILDALLKPLPPGVPGQIFIGGEGVARGYLHHPELTAERFLTTEDLPTAGRLYQTGDLARYRHDGSIEYLGRMDQQVKIRGFRIELGEIEAVLRQHPKVKDAVVVMQRDAALDGSLAAYVTASSRLPYPAELLAFQRQYLPSSMVANEIVVLNHLPLTPNGKVDRKALMERRIDATEKAVVPDAPLTDIERKLVSIWEKHFNRSPIGIDEDFFALGGHSLLAFRIFSEIEKRLRAPLLLSLLFRAPTIRQLATEIERQGHSKAKGDEERRAKG